MDLARTRQPAVAVTLIALKNAELAFGLTPLLDGASLVRQGSEFFEPIHAVSMT